MQRLSATFLERPNRFVARVLLADGNEASVHVASSGRMLDILIPGAPVFVELNEPEPSRKTEGRLLMVQAAGTWISVDTSLPGKLFRQATASGAIPAFAAYSEVRPEYPYGKSRIDFLLSGAEKPPCLVEVKSVTSALPDPDGSMVARFPDAPTSRGTRHLRELAEALRHGYRAAVFFIIQRNDVNGFGPYVAIDPEFSATLRGVASAGVEVYAWKMDVSPDQVRLDRPVPIRLGE